MPGSMAVCVTVRARVRRPPPHDTVHADQAAHCESAQSRAHNCAPHSFESVSGGQSLAVMVTLRDRIVVPPPHDTEHGAHDDHCDTLHAHAALVHAFESLNAPHAAPPFAGGVTTARVRRCSPAPHSCEHGLQVDHSLSWQSSTHAAAEHGALSLSAGHGAPLQLASVVAVRVRVRMPPLPHDTEQVDHAAHADTAHATGQQPRPQFAVSLSGGHGMPPLAAALVAARVRVFVADGPQLAVHVDHAAHADTAQSTGACIQAG